MVFCNLKEVVDVYTIAFVLRETRILNGLSQKELAKITGLCQSYISEMELGTKSPSLKTFEKICNALNVHPMDLLKIDEK